MSRHGYSDDCDDYWLFIQWHGALRKAINGKRGQEFFHALRTALDAMPEKRLISGDLVDEDGDCCAMGALCKHMGIDVSKVDPEDYDQVAKLFDINPKIVREVAFCNDDIFDDDIPSQEKRWQYMRNWVEKQLTSVV